MNEHVEHLRWNLPADLTERWLEAELLALPGPPASQRELPHGGLEVGAQRWRRSRYLSEARLLAALEVVRLHGIRVSVNTARPADGDAASAFSEVFRDQLGAFLLVAVADSVLDSLRNDVSDQLRSMQYEILRSDDGEIVASGVVAIPAIANLDAPVPQEVFLSKAQSTLMERREDVLALVNRIRSSKTEDPRGRLALPPLRPDHRAYLVDFIHELVENTRDHALEGITSASGPARFVLFRRRNVPLADAARLAAQAGEGSPLSNYFASYAARATRTMSMVEVTVADMGPGIPARIAGDVNIYRGTWSTERDWFQKAMEDGGTSKASTAAGAGLGLGNALRATIGLNGFVSIRTGRCEMTVNALHDAQPRIHERAFAGGTAVSLLWPWRWVQPTSDD